MFEMVGIGTPSSTDDFLNIGLGGVEGAIDVLPKDNILSFCKNNITISPDHVNYITANYTSFDLLNLMKSGEAITDVGSSIIFNCYYSVFSIIDPVTYSNLFTNNAIVFNLLFNLGFMYTDVSSIIQLNQATEGTNYWRKMGKYGGDFIMRIFYRRPISRTLVIV